MIPPGTLQLTGRRISRAGEGELARRSLWRLHPRDGPRERPQHADDFIRRPDAPTA